MVLYLLISAAAVAAAAIVNKTEGMRAGSRGSLLRRSCLFLIALILMVPAILRQETGNDYLRYVEFFHLASIDAYVPTEAGFNWLAKAVYGLCGYENYLLLFAIYAVMTILVMLTVIRQQAENFCFSFFLFMMFGYYFQSFNTMRYYFALSLSLLAMTCLLRRKYAGFVILVLLAALFHKTALITLLLYPVAARRWKKWDLAAGVALGLAVLLLHEKAMELLLSLYPSWEGTVDLAAGTSISWVNIAKCLAVLLLAYYVRADEDPETFRGRQLVMYWNSAYIGLLLYVFGWFIPEVSRICYYLTFTQIFYLPMLLSGLPETEQGRRQKKLLTILVIAAALVFFALFLRTAYRDTIKILPYKSFLFHDLNRTPSASVGGSY
ncbi:MAG: EpsG family protein [Firmicutes bacterium]|nr:EpsG family protein [Bacillota bacterium]